MTCDAAEELISELIDGELSDGVREQVEAHLAGCDACATVAKKMRRTVRFVRANARTMLHSGTPGGNYMEFTRGLVDTSADRTGDEVARDWGLRKEGGPA